MADATGYGDLAARFADASGSLEEVQAALTTILDNNFNKQSLFDAYK